MRGVGESEEFRVRAIAQAFVRHFLQEEGVAFAPKDACGDMDGFVWKFDARDKQMSAGVQSMHDDPAHRWTLQKLAERVGMSRSIFALKFKETVGASPMEYLTRWRMLLAGDRLTNSGDPISIIALSLGYESESAFSKAFKRVMGCSPRQYSRGRNLASPSHSEGEAARANHLEPIVDMRG